VNIPDTQKLQSSQEYSIVTDYICSNTLHSCLFLRYIDPFPLCLFAFSDPGLVLVISQVNDESRTKLQGSRYYERRLTSKTSVRELADNLSSLQNCTGMFLLQDDL